jgi:hypothetical protein
MTTMTANDPPMFALTEKALASSELSNHNIDPIQMYVEHSSEVRATRRASLTAAPVQQVGRSHSGGADDDARSIRSARSSRSRRASMSSAMPPSMMGPSPGYGGDEDESTEDERSVYSSKPQRRNNRRTSLSGGGMAKMLDAEEGYGREIDPEIPVYTNRPATRRGSATGGRMPRRSSSSGNGAGMPVGRMPRRGSSGTGAGVMPAPRIATRRGSAGFGSGSGHGVSKSNNAHVPMPRRMSNGMPMPRSQGIRAPHPADSAPMPPTELKRFETTDSIRRENNTVNVNRRSSGEPTSPKIQRNTTADSFEMRQMSRESGNKTSSFTRRGGRRGVLDEKDDVEETPSDSSKQSPSVSSNNKSPSVSSNKSDAEEDADADANFEPFAPMLGRNNTSDSIDLMQMAQGARAPPKAGAGHSRRGGRRGADNDVPPSPAGGRRGVVRHGTADSMTMGQMGRSASSIRHEDKKEQGPPTSVGVMMMSSSTIGDLHISEDEIEAPPAGGADTVESREVPAGNTRRGGRRGDNVGQRRMVVRTGTCDSLDTMRTSLSKDAKPEPTDESSEDEGNDENPEQQQEAETDEKKEKEETSAPVFDGINPDVLARMSLAASGPADQEVSDLEDEEEEDEDPYGYGKTDHSNAYGYGNDEPNDAPSDSEASQGSRFSARSARSGRSMRRNSTIIRPDQQTFGAAQLMATPALPSPALPCVVDSDLDDASPTGGDSSEEETGGAMYGYGSKLPPVRSFANNVAQDSGNESDATGQSMSSARRTRRRNSCLIRPEKDQTVNSSLLENASPMSDRDMEPDEDDFNDPDSLLNKSGYGATPNDPPNDPDSLLNKSGFGAKPKLQKLVSFNEEEEDPLDGVEVKPIHVSSSNTAIKSKPMPKQKSPWNRDQPFTSPRQVLTKEKLLETEKLRTKGEEVEIPDTRGNWGDVDLSIGDDESPSDSSEESYGASLYVDKKSSDGYRDIDRYKQKARRRASMEQTCIDIDKFEPSTQMKTSKLPKFTPAVGCTNASDFLVRCFAARLRAGITVIKHNRSRWSKSQLRTLFLLPDGKTLSWRNAEGDNLKGGKAKRPKLDLIRCVEVRHAWSRDPSTKKQTGTAVMRKRCKDGLASRSYALIFNKRTLDMTALTTDQCKLLMEGFTALCFRLHLDRMEHESQSDGADNSRGAGENSNGAGDDWASTVYGANSTASLSLTNTTNALSPWGL